MNRTRTATALASATALLTLISCGADTDTNASDTTMTSPPDFDVDALVALVVSQEDLVDTQWVIEDPFADQPDPTPNPTDCAAFDPIFALGDLPSVSAEFAGQDTTGAHTVRIVDELDAADVTVASVDQIVTTCPVLMIEGSPAYEVSEFEVSDGRGLVLAGAGSQTVIVIQVAGRVVSTIEVSSPVGSPGAVDALVEAAKQHLSTVEE